MTTRVVHINDGIEGAVYIGRSVRWRPDLKQSKWANWFGVKSNGRDGVIHLFRQHLTLSDGKPLLADLPELRGLPLACWCRHDGEAVTDANRCHGDVLKELLDTYTDDELRAMASADTEWSL